MTPDLGDTVLDFDFHPDEDDVRVFTIPRSGVLLADPGVLVYEVRYGQVVRLLSFLSDIVVFGPSAAPAALPESVVALADFECLKVRPGGHRLPP